MRRWLNMFLPLAVTAIVALSGPSVMAQTVSNDVVGNAPKARDVRFVVIYWPGPAWRPGVAPMDQPGMYMHVDHYRSLRRQGKLFLEGPFLDTAGGGMMIPSPGLAEAEIRQFAAADPAVQAGLLRFEVRPWLLVMSP